MGGVAEGVEIVVLIVYLVSLLWEGYGRTVRADEEFVIAVVAGDVGGVAGRVGGFVWGERAGECPTVDCEFVRGGSVIG